MTTPEEPHEPPVYGTPPSDPGSPPPVYGAPAPPPPPAYGATPPPAYGAPQPPPYGAPQPPAYGSPPPGYGNFQAPGYPAGPPGAAYGGHQLGSWIERVAGYLIDLVIVAIPSGIIGVLAGSRAVYDILAFVGGLVIFYLNGSTGQSPGKRVLHLKVLKEADGQLLGGGMGIVRGILHLLDSLACLIGWLWPLWDDKRQTFADKIVSTVVIKV